MDLFNFNLDRAGSISSNVKMLSTQKKKPCPVGSTGLPGELSHLFESSHVVIAV